MLQERVLAYMSPPKIFHSDNGREFVNNLIRATSEKWGDDVTFNIDVYTLKVHARVGLYNPIIRRGSPK